MPAVYRQPQPSTECHGKRQDIKRRVTSQSPPRLCRVCGQEAAGIYFSALVCLPCKSFFLRCANGKEPNVKCEKKNCKINAATRTICKFCRYKRCLAIGMTRKELPEKADAGHGQELCRVCGDVANGVHFGAVTCEGCKNFFRRSLSEETVICKKGGNCVVNLKTRKGCRGCRYRKCIAAGMSKEAKKPGRRNRPVEIFANNINNMSVSMQEVSEKDVISDELFGSYQTENLAEMETSPDLMGQSYDPFGTQSHNSNQDFTREYKLELCSGSSQCGTDTDAFCLIDDFMSGNYTADQLSPVQNVANETMWNNNGIVINQPAESYITLEPVPNLLDGATMERPLSPEGACSEDFASTSTLSSPSWSPTPSSDSNMTPLSPRLLSKIVIASFDSECPMHATDNCYDFSNSVTDISENKPSGDVSSDSFEYSSNTGNVTDFDNSSITLNDALNDVMELLTEEFDLTPITNGGTSGELLDSKTDSASHYPLKPERDAQYMPDSFDCWFTESSIEENEELAA